jgi:SdrD B-like domain
VFTIAPGVAGDTVADGDPATVAQFVNPTIDAGFFQSGSVGDTVWQDTNRNGQLDFAEPGVPGVTVTLYDGAGNIIATTTTDAQGRYLFTGLPPGDYAVGFSGLPSGLAITGQDLGGDDTRDSDVNPATGRTAVFRLGPGENNPTLDMGLVQPNVQPPGGGVGGGVGGGGGQLPRTGSDTNVLLNVAAWFLIVGGVLCLLASVRVRRRAQVR